MSDRWLLCELRPELLFTDNETNFKRLFGAENPGRYVKDGINDYVVSGDKEAVNREGFGTKAAARYRLSIGGGETLTLKLRLTPDEPHEDALGPAFDEVFSGTYSRGRRIL